MNKQLKSLLELQKLNDAIFEHRKDIDALNTSIKNQRDVLEQERRDVEAIKAETIDIRKEQDKRELDLNANEADITKLLVQLNSAKTNEEYSALTRRIEEERRQDSSIEDEIILLMERTDQVKAKAVELIEDIDVRGKELDVFESEAKDKIAQYEAQIETLLRQSVELESRIDPDSLSLYKKVFEKHGGDALAPADTISLACGGCNMHITRETINNVIGGNGIFFCKSCNRILYVPEIVQ